PGKDGHIAYGSNPVRHDLRTAVQEEGSARLALDFAARRLGQAAAREQEQRKKIDFMQSADCVPHDLCNTINLQAGDVLPFNLLHDDQLFLAVDHHRHGGPSVHAHRGVRGLDRPLDVLWMVVCAANDDQILDSPDDKELTSQQETKIAGSQEWAFT